MHHFHDEEAAGVAIETLQAVSTKLRLAVDATRLLLPKDDQECIEALTDRLIGLRETVNNINEALQAILRLAQEDENDNA